MATEEEKNKELEEKIKQVVKESHDWEKIPTTIKGIFLVKVPGRGDKGPTVLIELNPADESGAPSKRRGLYIKSYNELLEFQKMINNEKLTELAKTISQLYPTQERKRVSKRKVVEI